MADFDAQKMYDVIVSILERKYPVKIAVTLEEKN